MNLLAISFMVCVLAKLGIHPNLGLRNRRLILNGNENQPSISRSLNSNLINISIFPKYFSLNEKNKYQKIKRKNKKSLKTYTLLYGSPQLNAIIATSITVIAKINHRLHHYWFHRLWSNS